MDRTAARPDAVLASLPTKMRPRPRSFLARRFPTSRMRVCIEIGKPDVVGPSIAVDRGVVAAAEIRAVDQVTTNARGAHFGEGDFLSDDRGPHKAFTEAATTGEISLSILESVSKPSRIVG